MKYLLLILSQCLVAQVRLENNYGYAESGMVFEFDSLHQHQTEFLSRPLRVKVQNMRPDQHLSSQFQGCRIGNAAVPEKDILLLFDGSVNSNIARLSQGVNLQLRVRNPLQKSGTLSCLHSALYFNEQKLADIEIHANILLAPQWKNPLGAEIAYVVFDFSGLIAGTVSNAVIESSTSLARLESAFQYPASVDLLRPRGCRIGIHNVNNSHVQLKFNQQILSTNQNINISSNLLQSFQLSFAGAGGYGNKSGAVFCHQPGSLTYTY
jgi:hypothetical protein